MFSKQESPLHEGVLKMKIKKQKFEAFHEEFVKPFITCKSNKDFHNFRLGYQNRIREV